MENASKALLIAAAVLIVIILIAFGMIILNSTQDTAEHAQGVGSSISDSTEKATSKLLGIFGKTGKDEGEVINKGSLKHNGIVPEGGSYYIATLGTTIAAGEEMPDAPGNGDIYRYGDYHYEYGLNDLKYGNYIDGWSVWVEDDLTKTIYGEILEEINGSAIVDMQCTFIDCKSLIEAPKIPDSVTYMAHTFTGCTSLTKVPTIPKNVKVMFYAFSECTSLKEAPEIPDSVVDMDGTFYFCTSLKEVPDIPDSVENMDDTFCDCTALKTAPKISKAVKSMCCTFSGCTALETAPQIPDSVTDMFGTFYNCTSLTTAPDIPDSVTRMGWTGGLMLGTFDGCTLLKGEITINANPSEWHNCFRNTTQKITIIGECSELTKQRLAGTADNGNVSY